MNKFSKVKSESRMGHANVNVAIDVNSSLAADETDLCSAHVPLHMENTYTDTTAQTYAQNTLEFNAHEDFHARKRLGKLRDLNRELITDKKHRAWKPSLAPISEDSYDDYETQMGLMDLFAISGGFANLAKYCNVDFPEWIINEVEDVVLVFLSLYGQTTISGAIATIISWVKRHFSKSLTTTIKNYLTEMLTSETCQSNAEVIEIPKWLVALKAAKTDWSLARHNAAFGQLSKLLGLLVTLGLCKASNLEFRLKGFLLFAPEIQKKHATAFDLLDATFETVLFFVEGMYLCFATKSLKPLLVSDHAALQLDVEFATIMSEWDLVQSGNLMKIKGLTDQHFERRMNDLSTNLKKLAGTLMGFDKKLVLEKFEKILTLQNDFVTMKVASGVRHSPYALLFFGDSSQGKTTAADQCIDALCVSQNLPAEKKFRATLNAGDKFMSNWTTDKIVAKFDDLCNDKSNFVEKAPTRAILDVINNEPFYAPKADLTQKGKVFVEPWIVTGTTNKKDMDAGLYSNCPYSIQRRFITVTVKAKKEFQLIMDGIVCGIDSTKVREYNEKHGDNVFDDIWTFTVERPVKPDKLSVVADYKALEWEGQVLEDIDMKTLIQFLCSDFDKHLKNQNSLLANMKKREESVIRCPHPGCRQIKGYCPYHKDEEESETQIGGKIVNSFKKLVPIAKSRINPTFCDKVEDKAAQVLYEKGRQFLLDFDWIMAVPAPLVSYMLKDSEKNPFEGSWRQSVYKFLYADIIDEDYERRAGNAGWLCFMYVLSFYLIMYDSGCVHYGHAGLVIAYVAYTTYMNNLMKEVETQLLERLKERNIKVAPIVKRYRDDVVKYVCGVSVAVGSLYVMGTVIRNKYAAYKTQGSLAPVTQKEVDARDAETNQWTTVVPRSLPISDLSKTVTASTLQGVIDKNLVCCQFGHKEGKVGQLNCLFVKSNVVLVPSHYFDEFGDVLNCSFFKENATACGGKFAARLELQSGWKIPGTDVVMCYCPTGGSFRDLTKHFPLENLSGPLNVHLSYRFATGKLENMRGSGTTSQVTIQGKYSYEALNYALTHNTFPGMCGAVVHTETVGSVICGIHLAGKSDTPNGVCGLLNQAVLKEGYKHIRNKEGVLLTGTAEKFETQILGKSFVNPGAEPHAKSPVRFMPPESQVEYYGTCTGTTTSKSDVKVTPISEAIIEICGEPNIYMGPVMQPEWFGYQECLSNLAIPAVPYEYDLLKEAVVDYKSDLLEIFKRDLWSGTRPLTDLENWSGIPGLKFVDAIKLNTSVGFPLSGAKSKYVYVATTVEELQAYYAQVGGEPTAAELERLAPEQKWCFQVVKPISEISEEIERIEDCYRRGERGYTIAKACKKDEILSKKKCRIFYGNAIALTFLIRKYYLPLLRVLQMNPLVSECAVGINSHGPEWDEFFRHVRRFGMDRLIGGDYGKYDQKLPSQLIIASLRILIDCASVCDYSEEDLGIMETMVGDIVYSVIAFNGDLIGLTEGTHISGNSLTVIINGICGSLNLRCYFYSHPENKGKKFRESVALMTYGDDNIGSVSKGVNNFTIKGASEFLAKYGQTYTMPDKESELLDFLPEEEFEFLKRKSVYHEKLGVNIGALVDKSCFKMLHCFMRRKGSPDTEDVAAAKNIDTALSEWFNHGEKLYELRREQMKKVAEKCNIAGYCTGLDLTYDDRVDNWKNTYEK